MSEKRYEETARQVKESSARLCWSQWVTLGAGATPEPGLGAASIVDPEALVAMSLLLHSHERRLLDLVGWWAGVGSRFISVQRMQTVLGSFPPDPPGLLRPFARMAVEAGDRRWKRHVSGGLLPDPRAGKGPTAPRLTEGATVWLRLRAAFGVGAKADTLTFLLGVGSGPRSVREVAVATGYSSVAIRTAVQDMVLGRLIREVHGHPARYFAPEGIRAELFERSPAGGATSSAAGLPRWRYWAQLYPFFAHTLAWADRAKEETQGERAMASSARDLFEHHQSSLLLNAIPIPDLSGHRGLEFLDGFENLVGITCSWALEHL